MFLTSVTHPTNVHTAHLNFIPPSESKQLQIDIDVRKTYFKTLNAMKNAHFKTYFEMQNATKEKEEGLPLPRLFKSFHPCPFKLTIIEFCKKPLNLTDLPEILQDFKAEFTTLHRHYQKLDSQMKKDLIEGLVEDNDLGPAAFNDALDSLLEQIDESPHALRLSLLLRTFKKDVCYSKELISFLNPIIKMERRSLNLSKDSLVSFESLLIRSISLLITECDHFVEYPIIFDKYSFRLAELRDKYNILDSHSKFFLNKNFNAGLFCFQSNQLVNEIFSEIRAIIVDLRKDNLSLFPSLIDLNFDLLHQNPIKL